MKKKSISNNVAMSSFMLPIAIVVASLLWVAHAKFNWQQLEGWILCLITTYIFIEFNNAYTIIRIRTQMASSCFVLWMGVAYFLHPLQNSTFVVLCMLLSYYSLFGSYQQSKPVRSIFHSFLFLGIGSLFFPPLLCFVPIYYWSITVYLRSITIKSFLAGIVGIITPYWFLTAYAFYCNTPQLLISHFTQSVSTQLPSLSCYLELGIERIFLFALFALLNIISIVHYTLSSYSDKIKNRMYFNLLILHYFSILLLVVLQPQHFDILFGFMLMNSSPLLARFFALTRSRFTDILFVITLLLLATISIYTLLWK